jgi:hypothetical protein
MLPGMPREVRGEGVNKMPEHSMRLHPLAPDVKCPACGDGLGFIRVRKFGDLYQCACGRQVLHYVSKEAKACGYALMYTFGAFGKWASCVTKKGSKAEEVNEC